MPAAVAYDQREENKGVAPRFYIEPIEDMAASREAGRPIFRDQEFVEIFIAGDKNNIPCHKVTDEHRERWPVQYEAFRRGVEAPINGTPLTEWPAIPKRRIMELNAQKIYSIEELANLPDAAISKIGLDGRAMVKKAQAWLASASGGAEVMRLAEENETMKRDMEMLKEQGGIEGKSQGYNRGVLIKSIPDAIGWALQGYPDKRGDKIEYTNVLPKI